MFFKSRTQEADSEITPIADIMSGLMVVFLFISIAYMSQVKKISASYYQSKDALYEKLATEFAKDLPEWKAEIDKTSLTVRFREPDVLFKNGESKINSRFQEILDNFIPRYVEVLYSPEFRDQIAEVRIEGHTSSKGRPGEDQSAAYLSNMQLSQDRSRAVLGYSLEQLKKLDQNIWLRAVLTANGMSSKNLIKNSKGIEDEARSRRVEFRVRVKSEDALDRIRKGGA